MMVIYSRKATLQKEVLTEKIKNCNRTLKNSLTEH